MYAVIFEVYPTKEGKNEYLQIASTLKDFLDLDIDMFTMLIIGNSKTYVDSQGKMITPRGYKI